MGVRVQHGVHVRDVFPQGLLTQIRGGIQQNAGARGLQGMIPMFRGLAGAITLPMVGDVYKRQALGRGRGRKTRSPGADG